MNIKEAYCYGFAAQLARLGMSPSEFEDAWLKKQAIKGIPGATLALGATAAGTALLLPWLAGNLVGYQFGGGRAVSKADIKHIRQTSILSAYADAIKRMRLTNRRKLRSESADADADPADEKEKAMVLPKSSQYTGAATAMPPAQTGQLTVKQRIDELRNRLNKPMDRGNQQTSAIVPGIAPVPSAGAAVARQGLGVSV